MKLAQDDPDGLVAAFLGKDLAQEDEPALLDPMLAYRAGRILLQGLLDLIQILVSQRFPETFHLEIIDFSVVQVAILIVIA